MHLTQWPGFVASFAWLFATVGLSLIACALVPYSVIEERIYWRVMVPLWIVLGIASLCAWLMCETFMRIWGMGK